VRSTGLRVEFRAWGPAPALSPGVDLTAYRIVQEALTNTIRHAPGATAQVEIGYEGEFLTIRVADTGSPSARDSGARVSGARVSGARDSGARDSGAAVAGEQARGTGSRGYGLAGIAERVASCGGTLAVGPREAGGFVVTARLPVQ
jgi:signal transduction histidine kinase